MGENMKRKTKRVISGALALTVSMGMTVNVQGINTPEDLREMVTLGVNLVSTDNPVMVLDSLPAIVKSLVSVPCIP